MTLGTALRQGVELLQRGGISVPRLTAEVLLAHAIKHDRTYLFAHPEQELREVEWIHYGRYLHERLKHKPTQYITKTQEFYGRPFLVTSDVLIPRPETEHLIEVALPLAKSAHRIIDVGTGSGAIAITLALETQRTVIAIDISPSAIAIAAQNATTLNARVVFVCADSLTACAPVSADVIVSNPPYVAAQDRETLQREVRDWEPELALFAGPLGLDFYRMLIPQAQLVLKPGGSLVMELGAGQSAAVTQMFGEEWERPAVTRDLAGIDRVMHARKRP
jgi:release factor glutamine methyltransferase